MSKRVLILISVSLSLLMLAACGGTPSGTENSNDPQSDGAAPSTVGNTSQAGTTTTTPNRSAINDPERSKILNIGCGSKATSLDPGNFRDYGSEMTIRSVFEPLIYSDHTGSEYIPMLAERWEMASDGMSFTFYLREGVFWHNGDPFSADDVVYTFQRSLDRRDELSFVNQYMPDLQSAEKIDDYTIRIHFSKPTPLATNALISYYIIPKKAHEQYGDDLFHLQYCYGTGPWMLNEWIDGQYAHYLKNPNYWNKDEYDPYFEEVYIRYTPEASSAIAAHVAGTLDAYVSTGGVTDDIITSYAGTEDRIELVTVDTNSTMWFGLSFKEGSIWQDPDVRRAFDLAIDRQLIIDTILGGKGSVPTGYFHSSILGYDETLGQPEYNPELARELLANSSYDGRPFALMVSQSTLSETIFLAVMDMVNSIGFNMSVDLIDISVFTPRQNAGDYDIFTVTNSIPDGIPQRQLQRIPQNFDKTGYVNETMNELIGRVFSDLDAGQRYEYARQVNQMIYELKAPFISLLHRSLTQAINYGVVGIDLFSDGLYNFTWVDYDPSQLP